MLLFKRRFFEAIRARRKTQTIRFWRRSPLLVGTLCRVPNLGYVRIQGVDPVDVGTLTEADALADGFACLDDLRAAIRDIYGAAPTQGRCWYRIRFVWVGEHAPTPLLGDAPGSERGGPS